ncbi:MAG TPA: hypothetical protein VG326_04110 [Tepidisphaeraceae bacterium]|nr:hypothetical protein [Tepidisphaeraceae bacterium]
MAAISFPNCAKASLASAFASVDTLGADVAGTTGAGGMTEGVTDGVTSVVGVTGVTTGVEAGTGTAGAGVGIGVITEGAGGAAAGGVAGSFLRSHPTSDRPLNAKANSL